MKGAQLPTELARKVLLSTLAEEGFDPKTLHYEVLSGVEGEQENWLGSVYKVAVYPDKTESNKKLSLFVKCLIKSERSDSFRLPMFFVNEVAFYEEVLPPMMKFQEQSKARVSTPFTGAPKCYKAVSDGQNDVIILEDVSVRGYVMPKRLDGMTLEETRMMFEELGRFHALSLAMKDQMPAEFSKISKAVKNDVLFVNMKGDPFKEFIELGYKDALKLLKEKYPHDSIYIKKAQQFEDDIHDRMSVLMGPSSDDRYDVINHGDLWINNFMYRYRGEGSEKQLDSMCFLDYQIACYTSIGADLTTTLYTTVDRKMRDEHRDELLRAYHDALSKLMSELGSNPTEIFPFSAVEEVMKSHTLLGVGVACVNVTTQLNAQDDSELEDSTLEGPDAAVKAVISILLGKSERCKQWMVDLLTEVVDRGYFD